MSEFMTVEQKDRKVCEAIYEKIKSDIIDGDQIKRIAYGGYSCSISGLNNTLNVQVTNSDWHFMTVNGVSVAHISYNEDMIIKVHDFLNGIIKNTNESQLNKKRIDLYNELDIS